MHLHDQYQKPSFHLILAKKWPGTSIITAIKRIAEDATVTGPAEETKAQEETKEMGKGATETEMIKTMARGQSSKP